jgi:uncharacterized protein (DUF433 family)
MPSRIGMLKSSEAAVVAGVAVRDVNRAIDERILPDAFFSVGEERQVAPVGCTLIDFYFSSAHRLTGPERTSIIGTMSKRLDDVRTWPPANLTDKDWLVKDDFLTIDLSPFFKAAKKRMKRLAAARDLVESDPEILSGTPVVRGTRIPVYDVAASVASGIPAERILAAYPALDAQAIDLAVTYAAANPPRGRPRATPRIDGVEVVKDDLVPRRRKAE